MTLASLQGCAAPATAVLPADVAAVDAVADAALDVPADAAAVDAVADAPAVDALADAPAVDAPAVDALADAPAVDAPAVDALAVDALAVDALAVDALGVDALADAPAGPSCTARVDCADDGNPCTVAECVAGRCVHRAAPAGSMLACDDGDPCTLGDRCESERCAGATELVLLSGARLPMADGWVGYGDATATSQAGARVRVDTTPLASGAYATHGHALPPGAFTTHDLQWELAVASADHNPGDATAVILPDFYGYFGASGPIGPVERQQMIYFDDTEIGWGDLSQTAALDTHAAHVYRLHVTPTGGAELRVDGSLALTRPAISVAGANVGFGDQTNDPGVNGRFEIWGVRLVPQPRCQ
ncbi:MAG: hypothetical protein Q8S73_20590 [Deltaproteobacteria bacterium]|nr:hypothetical protein [Myxococcales bacterium]MDP3216519.1 hypothetical protein [Deltaproteobacteria bacterium]